MKNDLTSKLNKQIYSWDNINQSSNSQKLIIKEENKKQNLPTIIGVQ